MNCSLTQLNTSKNTNQLKNFSIKHFCFLFFFFGLMFNNNPVSAQGCPSGDPLQWDWLQEIIANSNGCHANEIRKFNYEGSTYFYTVYDRTGVNCESGVGQDHFDAYFDCNGNGICAIGGIAPPCDLPIVAGRDNYTTIWAYEDTPSATSCPEGDPLQWTWIQDLIAISDGDNIAAIHQFEFEGNTYFNTVNADLNNEPNSLFFNCEGEQLCEVVSDGYSTSPCDDLDLFLASFIDFTILWSYENPFPAVTCPQGEPLQWSWIQNLIAEAEVCKGGTINQFYYSGNTYFQVLDNSPVCNFISGYQIYYNCKGETVCYYDDSFGGTCDSNFLSASSTANNVWTYNPSSTDICPQGDPLQWEWMQTLIERSEVCNVGEIQQFEYNGFPYFQTVQSETLPQLCGIGTGIVFDCKGYAICEYGSGTLFGGSCDTGIISASNNNNTIWANEYSSETCPQGDPLQWDWVQNLIQSAGYCSIGELRQFEYEDETYFYNTPREFDDGVPCKADYYPYKYYNCNGEYVCEVSLLPPGDNRWCSREFPVSLDDYSTIWVYEDEPVSANQMKCPDNNTTSICAPVSIPPSMAIQDFSTTDDPNYMNSMSMQMQEQTDVQQYFTTTTRVYTITDESGNHKTCETQHHIANQFLQLPAVSEPGVVCEEELWSYVKIGTDQYKLYSDHNGSKGTLMSTCNTPSLICSTADLGVDTKVSGQYLFWASTYFEFPDGSICESEAMPFYVNVHAKPVAELSVQNKSVNIGEGIQLMDIVENNMSGYWSGENIVYLITQSGDNMAYFSANQEGIYKLYYTVKNEHCQRSYLMIIEVNGASGKPVTIQQTYKPIFTSFNIYPNPASNKVFIDLPNEAAYQISLTDISGKIVKQLETKIGKSMVEMNVNDLSRGMYLVELKNASNHILQKLIIE